MNILAFETSCDDTAVAIVKDGNHVLANVRDAQPDHARYGGVVPEIAARLHSEHWRGTLERCFSEANLAWDDIDSIAVTQGPGLQTSLLTGTSAASFLSLLYDKPVIPVHHIHGHVLSSLLDRDFADITFPYLALTVSGGHTSFYLCANFTDIQLLGTTRDDAAGEAFDKCAKMLGLSYPGGPIVSQRAEQGDRRAFKLPRILLEKETLDFSFSGLKASLYRIIETEKEQSGELSDEFINNVCASFEFIVGEIFTKKLERALEKYPEVQQIHFVGGVSANRYLREQLQVCADQYGAEILWPMQSAYCTDNAAMIAAAAYVNVQKNAKAGALTFIDAQHRLAL